MDIVVEWERIQYSAKHAKCIINLGWYELMLRLCFSPWDFLSHDPWSLPKGLSHLFSHLPFSAPILNYSLKIVVCLRSDMGRARSYQIVAEMCYRSPWISCNPITIFPTNGPTLGKSSLQWEQSNAIPSLHTESPPVHEALCEKDTGFSYCRSVYTKPTWCFYLFTKRCKVFT